MHQTNHLAKIRKNAFDKATSKLLAEIDFSRKAIVSAILGLKTDTDRTEIIIRLQNVLIELENMKQNRG